jgi:hypothetical protein
MGACDANRSRHSGSTGVVARQDFVERYAKKCAADLAKCLDKTKTYKMMTVRFLTHHVLD